MKHDRFRRTAVDHDLDALTGYLGLGMKRQSLALAQRLLRQINLTAHAFSEAVDAILIQATRLRPWAVRVEAAYALLPPAAKTRVRLSMLSFYVATENWKTAVHFLPAESDNPTEVLFTIWTLIELRQDRALRQFYLRLPEPWRTGRIELDCDTIGEHELKIAMLCEALGCYHARMGRWRNAERWWNLGSRLEPFKANAMESLVKLQAVRALRLSRQAQHDFADEEEQLHEEFPHLFSPPKKQPPANAEVRRFRHLERHLGHIVPLDDRFRFDAWLE